MSTTWKTGLNKALEATIGYRLTRARPVGKRAAKKAAPKKKKAEFPVDFDDDIKQLIRAVRPYTMTGNDKLHALISATRYIHQHKIPGAVLECGVWRGGSMHAVARTLDALGDHTRDLYLFDTYEGMPEPTAEDRRFDDVSAKDLLANAEQTANVWAIASLEDVKQGFEQVPYPGDRVHFVEGKVEDTIPEHAPEQIALMRLDTDWYASTKHEFDNLYDRLVPGGVLFIDDYGWWQGSRQATDEFLERTGERLLLVRTGSGRVAVKP